MATAAITVSATASGLPEGGVDQLSYTMTNTSAANTVTLASLTTLVGTATPVVLPSSAQFIMAFPAATTNTNAWFVTASTAQAGIPMSSNGFALLRVAGGSTVYFYAAAGAAAFTLRVLTY